MACSSRCSSRSSNSFFYISENCLSDLKNCPTLIRAGPAPEGSLGSCKMEVFLNLIWLYSDSKKELGEIGNPDRAPLRLFWVQHPWWGRPWETRAIAFKFFRRIRGRCGSPIVLQYAVEWRSLPVWETFRGCRGIGARSPSPAAPIPL